MCARATCWACVAFSVWGEVRVLNYKLYLQLLLIQKRIKARNQSRCQLLLELMGSLCIYRVSVV